MGHVRLALALGALLSSSAAIAQTPQGGTVSNLSFASTPYNGSELLYLVQNGVSKKTNLSTILATVAGVTSFNTRIGAVTLQSGDIIAALAYTPAPTASPIFTGSPTAPTQAFGDSSTKIATDAFVQAAVVSSVTGVVTFNSRAGNVSLLSADVTGALGYTPAHSGANSDITSLSGLSTPLSILQGGTGTTTATGSGSVVLATSPTISNLTASSTFTASGTSTFNSQLHFAGAANPGLGYAYSPFTGIWIEGAWTGTNAGGVNAHLVNTTSDNAVITGQNFLNNFTIQHSFGGSLTQGGRQTLFTNLVQSAATSTANASRVYSSLTAAVQTAYGDGGVGLTRPSFTGTFTNGNNVITGISSTTGVVNGADLFGSAIAGGATVSSFTGTTITMSLPAIGSSTGSFTVSNSKGAYYSINPVAILQSGATNVVEVTGGEINIAAQSGSSVWYKAGLTIAALGTDAVQGSAYDAVLSLSSQGGPLNGAAIGLMFSQANGGTPVTTTGTLIGSKDTWTVGNGIDFSGLSITGYFLHGPGGYTVDGAGNVVASTLVSAGTAKANAAVQAYTFTATPAGGATGQGFLIGGGVLNLGIFWGSGAPTLSAGQGSLYIRTDGSSTSTRLYVNTNGSTGWTNFTSAT